MWATDPRPGGPGPGAALPIGRRTWVLLLLLIGICAGSLRWTVHDVFLPDVDAASYLRTAHAIQQGQGYTLMGEPFDLRPPGLPVLLAGVLQLFGQDYYAMNLFMSLFGVLCVALFFLWLRVDLGDWSAFALSLTLWLNPQFQLLGNSVMSELPGLALLFATLLAERSATRTGGVRRHVTVGILAAAAIYMRTMFGLLLPALLIAQVLRRKSIRPALIVVVTAVVLLAPWSVRNALYVPDLDSDQLWLHSQWVAMWHSDKGDPASPLITPVELLARIRSQGDWMTSTIGHRLRASDPGPTASVAGGLALLAFLVVAARRREPADVFAVGMLLVLLIWHSALDRLLLPLFVFVLPAAVGAVRAGLSQGPIRAVAMAPALLVLALATFDSRDGVNWTTQGAKHETWVAEAPELNALVPPGVVLASSPRPWRDSVYLQRPIITIQVAERRHGLEAVDAVLDRHRVTAFLFRGGASASLRSHLSKRFRRTSLAPGLILFEREIEDIPASPDAPRTPESEQDVGY